MTNQEQYDARINRVKQALELKIPDRVPCINRLSSKQTR